MFRSVIRLSGRSSLKGKIIVVTGSANGIGRGIVEQCYKRGATIIGIDKDKKPDKSLLDMPRYTPIYGDVTNIKELEYCVNYVSNVYHKIDGLVNNAGTHDGLDIEKTDEKSFRQLFELNMVSAYNLSRLCFKYMKRNKHEATTSIVNISSMVGIVGQKDSINYGTTKSAMLGFTKSLALDVGKFNIRANCICPGWIETPLLNKWLDGYGDKKDIMKEDALDKHAIRRLGTPEDVGNAATFLLGNESSFITGIALPLDGGITLGY